MLKIIQNNYKKLKGFTISELLIALGVIAVLTTVLMPIVHSLVPDQNTLMAKRGFYTAETIIGGLINDTGCYPSRFGFKDGLGYRKCPGWGHGSADNASEKFITLFTEKLDIRGAVSAANGGGKTFQTKDGMQWTVQATNLAAGGNVIINIDVDGPNKGPACGQAAASGACEDETRTKGFDTFTIQVQPSGKMILEDCWAILAVRTDKKVIGKFEENANCN